MPEALPYHIKVCQHFREQKKTWDFFAAVTTKQEQLEAFRLDLLKNTYKFDLAADPSAGTLARCLEKAKSALGLSHIPVHLYQAQFAEEVNASIIYLNGEAFIVLSGRLTQLLSEDELLAVLAHELTHIKFFTLMNGGLEVATRIINAIAGNYNSEAAWIETARRFRLYLEIFCDRGALAVLGQTGPVITSLVKIATGLEKVSAASYVKQAEEIFTAEKGLKAATVTHPENFIRARAVQLWHDKGPEAEKDIIAMIEGVTDLDALDLFNQTELASLTRRFLQLFLKPRWFHTTLVLSQARQYFPNFTVDEEVVLSEEWRNRIGEAHDSVRDYLAYVLLDFILVDPALEAVPFGWGYQFAEETELKETFSAIIKKEFRFTDKKLQQHRDTSLAAYYEVKESAAEQIYED